VASTDPTPTPRKRPSFEAAVERVYVFADEVKGGVRETIADLAPFLEKRCKEVVVHRDLRRACKLLESRPLPELEQPDLIVVLGGDGSILSVVRAFGQHPVPILGINFGRIGFLASVSAKNWRMALGETLDGEGVLEPRMRLAGQLETRNGHSVSSVGLNDMVVQRGAAQGMMTLSLHDGPSWISDYRADGLILASPSGSTAHSLAAGGPILAPSMHGLVVTPISPQSLSHRPMVMHPESVLRIGVEKAHGLVTLAVDGHGFFPMQEGDQLVVRQHPEPYPLLARSSSDPYVRIRERLGWRGTFEPESGIEVHSEPSGAIDVGRGEVL
jgi:NAD+ kinase